MCCSVIYGRSFGRDEWRRGGKPAETPFPAAEIGNCGAQVFGAEIGPQGFDEVELRVGGFPQQEVGEALFAAAADEQVDIAAGLALRGSEETAERLGRGGSPAPLRHGDTAAIRPEPNMTWTSMFLTAQWKRSTTTTAD